MEKPNAGVWWTGGGWVGEPETETEGLGETANNNKRELRERSLTYKRKKKPEEN